MDLGLAGKRALVTGSSSGIGAGIAKMLAAEGCRVVVHGLSLDEARAVAAQIGPGTLAIAGDIATNDGADAVRDAVTDALGGIDILVNNVGGALGSATKDLLDIDEDTWAQTYEINVISAVRMIRRFLPGMKERGWGRIIQIASVSASQPLPLGPDYSCAKAAVINLTVSLARSLGTCGVTANTVSPGTTMTPALSQWIDGLARDNGWTDLPREEIERRVTLGMLDVPLGFIGRSENVATAVCMLASTPGGDYMTGGNVRCDGGQNHSVN